MRRSTGEIVREKTENIFSLLIEDNRIHELDHIFKFLTGIFRVVFWKKMKSRRRCSTILTGFKTVEKLLYKSQCI